MTEDDLGIALVYGTIAALVGLASPAVGITIFVLCLVIHATEFLDWW